MLRVREAIELEADPNRQRILHSVQDLMDANDHGYVPIALWS